MKTTRTAIFPFLFSTIVLSALPLPVFASELIEEGSSERSALAFVLRGQDGSTAFVRTDDEARLHELVESKGYELVVRETESGETLPVVGDIIPEEEALASREEVRKSAGARRFVDIGLGAVLGLTTGGKVRVMVEDPHSGVTFGIDLDAGTILFISDATVSALLGYTFHAGRHLIRPYATLGTGKGVLWAVVAVAEASLFRAGAGLEWKPARWFGLGLEGGIVEFGGGGLERGSYPYARLTTMFYFF